MNMFANMLGGLVDKEQIVRDTIEACLENVSKELNCAHNELFIMIRPTNDEFDFKCWIYHNNKAVREITLKEILEAG